MRSGLQISALPELRNTKKDNKEAMFEENIFEDKNLENALTIVPEAFTDKIMEQVRPMLEEMVGYRELEMMYVCTIKELRTKFEVLNTEFNTRYRRNPIHYISTRLKSTSGIMEKMIRNNIPISLVNIEENINDIAGVRIICSYIDDIYALAESLGRQDDITILKVKDYIKNPKPNGYRSLHLIVELPIFFADQKKMMKAEVQIRTTAMDYWANLEHQLKYKKEIPQQNEIVAQLKECADTLSKTDRQMLEIRKEIESATEVPDRDEILMEKLKNFDKPIL